MSPKRTSRSNDHRQRKLDVARSRLREYLFERDIDAVIEVAGDKLHLHVTNPYDVIYIPLKCRGVEVICLTTHEHE
jgi:hypothetical protein